MCPFVVNASVTDEVVVLCFVSISGRSLSHIDVSSGLRRCPSRVVRRYGMDCHVYSYPN